MSKPDSKGEDCSPEPLLLFMFVCFDSLRRLGWKEAMYAPKGKPLELIEAGSTGIHRGIRDEIGFWIFDERNTWPSHPILYRELKEP